MRIIAKYEKDGEDYFPSIKSENNPLHLSSKPDGIMFKHIIHIIESLPKKPMYLHNLKKMNKLEGGSTGSMLIITSKDIMKSKYAIEVNKTAMNVWKRTDLKQKVSDFKFHKEITWKELF